MITSDEQARAALMRCAQDECAWAYRDARRWFQRWQESHYMATYLLDHALKWQAFAARRSAYYRATFLE
jgi:hypothetical protein